MIDGSTLARAIISGANSISNQKQLVDELNVFPVPDGDTGTNMSMTIGAGKQELSQLQNPTVAQAAEAAASALLRGARGNSGVILSLLFRGFTKGLKGKVTANGQDFAEALAIGVDAAYKAVMKPTEGTMLTVAREAAEAIAELSKETNDIVDIMNEIVRAAAISLENTPELLPVLKKAGVVDAGGKGLLIIFKGMQSVICNDTDIELSSKQKERVEKSDKRAPVLNAVVEYEGEITFGYCTEFIIEKNIDSPDSLQLRAYLESIGDSVVCVDDDDIIKVHVHTNDPGNAIQHGLKLGQLTNIKIDNMRIQHQTKVAQAGYVQQDDTYLPVDPEKQYGFVAVAAGSGLRELFLDLGVDKIVSGGQTMNPSTEDILQAIHATPAETVFVLPNNKNIIMAAEQAVKLADRRVCVLQTRTIPQGISAMLAFDSEQDYTENRLAMTKQLDQVQTGLVTFAARDSDFDGHAIKKGEILGLENGKLSFVEKDVSKTVMRLLRSLTKKRSSAFITVIYGCDVSDQQAETLIAAVREKYGTDYEINLVNGGQPVYYYILSVE